MIVALANGLGALHAANIVHRDVKPANLLIVGDARQPRRGSATVQRRGLLAVGERIVVGDLGLAKDQERTAAGPTIVGGTPLYRAPEQTRRDAEIGPPADVFAATAVMWNLLTGDVPAASDSLEAQLATVPPAWREVVPSRPRTGARGAIRHDARVGSGRARGARRGRPEPSGSASAPRHPARRVRTRAWRRSSPRTPRSSSVEKRSSTNWSRGCRPSRTLVIGGPSGSGKSSLLRAGLVPASPRARCPAASTGRSRSSLRARTR